MARGWPPTADDVGEHIGTLHVAGNELRRAITKDRHFGSASTLHAKDFPARRVGRLVGAFFHQTVRAVDDGRLGNR